MLYLLKRVLSLMIPPNADDLLIHTDGRKVFVRDIVRNTSADLYQTSIYYDICRSLSERVSSDPTTRRVLENIYVLKSKTVRTASAIAAYLSSTSSPVESIRVNVSVRSLIPTSLLRGISCNDTPGSALQRVTFNAILLLISKSFLHRVFRYFGRDPSYGRTFIRGWVEVTADMYPSEIRQGRLLIYPFPLNFSRQLRFILWCRRTGINYSLTGQPYPLMRIFWLLVKRIPYDIILADIEIYTNRRHAEELIRSNPLCFFTSDEFETAGFVLNAMLIDVGVRVVNTAHGVGNYCPNISYSEFRILSNSQREFYASRNVDIKYTLLEGVRSRIHGLAPYRASLNKPVMLVLIHQPFYESSLDAEADALRHLDAVLSELALGLSINYAIKMHPNYRPKRFGRANVTFNGNLIFDWAELSAVRPIFVTINSTVFFDARGIAPVLVYEASTFEPSLYFPRPYLGITIDDIEQTLRRLISPFEWGRAASFHAGEAPTSFRVERDEAGL